MRSTITGIQMFVRVAGVVQLLLGLAFWTGNALGLVELHMLNGILLVLALWTQAALAHRAGVPGRLVAGAFVWGLIVVALGLGQRELLPGSAHVVIEVLHLLVGLVALDLAETLATRAKARLTPATMSSSKRGSSRRGTSPDLSCTNSTRDQAVDVDHQPTDLAVGGSNPSRRASC
jgi:hypothetical protein